MQDGWIVLSHIRFLAKPMTLQMSALDPLKMDKKYRVIERNMSFKIIDILIE